MKETINYAKIRKIDISNGPGVRVSLFLQGCLNKCKNCFNPETWNLTGGKPFTKQEEDIILELMKPDYIKGLSILGGDPFVFFDERIEKDYDTDAFLDFLKRVKKEYPEKTIWLWTGYNWSMFSPESNTRMGKMVRPWLSYLDVIVDGPFIEELKDPTLQYAGSKNQLVIDVKESLEHGHMVVI